MKQFLITLIAFLPMVAFAQDDISQNNGIIGNGRYLGAKTVDSQTTVPVLGVNASTNTEVNALSGKAISQSIAKTPIATTDGTGTNYPVAGTMPRYPSVNIVTPAVTAAYTPNTGYTIGSRMNAIATAAPTAVFVQIPAATANVGKTFDLYNQGASPAQMVPVSGDSVNVVAAGTPYSCATQKLCECNARTTGTHVCTSK